MFVQLRDKLPASSSSVGKLLDLSQSGRRLDLWCCSNREEGTSTFSRRRGGCCE